MSKNVPVQIIITLLLVDSEEVEMRILCQRKQLHCLQTREIGFSSVVLREIANSRVLAIIIQSGA